MVQRRTLGIAGGAVVTAMLAVTALSGAWASPMDSPQGGSVVMATPSPTTPAPVTGLGAGEKVIFDTDFGQLNDDSLALYMLTQSAAEVLGVTTVAGNTYAESGTAYALRQLERVGRTDIPVHEGLKEPIFGSRKDIIAATDALHSKRGWHGAWDKEQPASYTDVADVYDGPPTTTPAEGSAPDFIVDQVRKHPGEVTIIAIGPLTNVAIAVKNHPEIVPLVKQIMYMGGAFDVPGNDSAPATEFNIWFDPDAARIVWDAPWEKQIVVPLDVTDTVQYSINEYNRIMDGADTTITQQFEAVQGPQFEKNPGRVTDIWDTIVPALLFQPDLVTRSAERNITVDTTFGLNYGRTLGYEAKNSPVGLQSGTIIQRIDNERFFDIFIGLLSGPIRHDLNVMSAVSSVCLGGNVWLDVSLTNTDSEAISATITTPFGSRNVNKIKPEATKARAFNSRSASIDEGTVEVSATAGTRTFSKTMTYEAKDCG